MIRYFVVLVFIFGVLNISYSQEIEPKEVAVEEEAKLSYGVVKSVDKEESKIVIGEYDYDKDDYVEVSYYVDSETNFIGVSSIDEISKDDTVDIEYVERDGRRVIKNINVAKEITEEK